MQTHSHSQTIFYLLSLSGLHALRITKILYMGCHTIVPCNYDADSLLTNIFAASQSPWKPAYPCFLSRWALWVSSVMLFDSVRCDIICRLPRRAYHSRLLLASQKDFCSLWVLDGSPGHVLVVALHNLRGDTSPRWMYFHLSCYQHSSKSLLAFCLLYP